MKIKDILKQNKQPFSFEFFPPKDQAQEQSFFETIKDLKKFNPEFVSVTYGAMGTTQETTFDMTKTIKEKFDIEVMPHLTCIGASKEKIKIFLKQLKDIGIDNVFALRGDVPEGVDKKDILYDFHYAVDLVKFIKQSGYDFSIGVAGFPEGHAECKDQKLYFKYLKEKVDAGADFILTQIFFENKYFLKFCKEAKNMGINIPIIPGIMPISNYKMIERITKMGSIEIPVEILDFFSKEKTEQECVKFSIDYALKQCLELKAAGISHFHFYTLNKSQIVKEICEQLGGNK